jgi:pyruvate kinase
VNRLTKIVATLGPATDDPRCIRDLINAGVDVFRLNFSHGDYEEKARQIRLVRDAEAHVNRTVAILQDLQGPKIRVGSIAGGSMLLSEGQILRIFPDGRPGRDSEVSVSRPTLASEVKVGGSIFLDDGAIALKIESVADGVIQTRVIRGGTLTDHKGVNAPGAALTGGCLTEKDETDLRFGIEAGVDIVALSFVSRPDDAKPVRAIMRSAGRNLPLIAKIERKEAFDHIGSIVRSFDGVMVARGDLGVSLPPEKVPFAQKTIIRRANAAGKPVITATQMLESMTFGRGPTRAEASDVANAVLDGTDAVMLSGETAVGVHPVETVRTMHRLVLEAETQDANTLRSIPVRTVLDAFCGGAVQVARAAGAAALVAMTRTGRTARTIASQRPAIPVIALCINKERARSLTLWRGIHPVDTGPLSQGDKVAPQVRAHLLDHSLVPVGKQVVIVASIPGTPMTNPNLLELIRL